MCKNTSSLFFLGDFMKKIVCIGLFVLLVFVLFACNNSKIEPIIQENHTLIVPPHFGQRPK